MTERIGDAGQSTESPIRIGRGSVRVKSGAYLKQGKKIYRISHILDFKQAVGVDVKTGHAEVLEIERLKRIEPEALEGFEHANRDLVDIGEEEWRIVEQRMQAIECLMQGAKKSEVEAVAKEHGVHVTTVYRWYRAYIDGGGVMGLLPRKEGFPKGRTRIDPETDNVIKEVIDSYYLTKQRPKVTAVINKVHALCEQRNIKPPSPGTVRNRIAMLNEYERLAKRYDRTIARDRLSPAPGNFKADYPLQVVQMDHTRADIYLVDEETRQTIDRPYLTIAIDIYSRMICGYYLSFEPPSAVSVGMCTVSAVLPKEKALLEKGIDGEWPVWGFMDTLHVDNGADFRSEALAQACLANEIKLDFRPVNETQFGGHVERVLGTLMDETHLLPGTTFSNVAEKGKYDPKANASMTISEYEEWLLGFIVNVYHKRPHKSLGKSPEEKYREGIFGTKEHEGVGFPPKPANPMNVMIDFLPIFRRTVQRTGVHIDGINYYDAVLRHKIGEIDKATGKKKKHVFRRDPRDISFIWFYDETERYYYRIPAADQSFPPMSAWEFAAAKKAAGEKAGKVDIREIVMAHDELSKKADEAKKKTKRARREAERKKVNEKHFEALGLKVETDASAAVEETVPDDLWNREIKPFEIIWADDEEDDGGDL